MGSEAQEVELSITAPEEEQDKAISDNDHRQTRTVNPKRRRTLTWWIRIAAYSVLLLATQAVATLLGRLYFDKGGTSKWLGTLAQLAGFPILFPYYLFLATRKKSKSKSTLTSTIKPSKRVLAIFYVTLGLIIAGDCYLYSVGLMYLPVSTYSLICASQLAFNAVFSFFINSQKFTPYIVNSLVLLTVSSILLVFNSDDEGPGRVSRGKFAVGFACTVGASAGYGLALSLTQFFFDRILKREDFRSILDLITWQSIVASLATVVGLFASGEWRGIRAEMSRFSLGEASYVLTLTWTAVAWVLFSVGNVGLIVEVSALFSNVIGVLGLPVVPVLAVVFFAEKMDGLKVVAMFLAIWGFASYVYQNYLDSLKKSGEVDNGDEER